MTRDRALAILREHEAELRANGVVRLRLFGSVARDEATDASDVDVLADFAPERPTTMLTLSRVRLQLTDLLHVEADLARETTLRSHVKERVLSEAIVAF